LTCATCAYNSRVNSSTSWSTSSQVSHRTIAVSESSRVLGGGAELWRLAAARNGHCVVGPLFCLQNLTSIVQQPWQFCDSSMLASLSPVTPAQYASTFGSNLCRSKHQLLVSAEWPYPAELVVETAHKHSVGLCPRPKPNQAWITFSIPCGEKILIYALEGLGRD